MRFSRQVKQSSPLSVGDKCIIVYLTYHPVPYDSMLHAVSNGTRTSDQLTTRAQKCSQQLSLLWLLYAIHFLTINILASSCLFGIPIRIHFNQRNEPGHTCHLYSTNIHWYTWTHVLTVEVARTRTYTSMLLNECVFISKCTCHITKHIQCLNIMQVTPECAVGSHRNSFSRALHLLRYVLYGTEIHYIFLDGCTRDNKCTYTHTSSPCWPRTTQDMHVLDTHAYTHIRELW